MKINGVGPDKMINLYSNNKRVNESKVSEIKKDSLEISSEARNLNKLTLDNNYINSPEKIEALKKAVSEGTYKVDSKSIAAKMIDIIKGRGI